MNRIQIAIAAVIVLAASPALAMDKFEIQVYQGEHNDPGQPSAELHTNYTALGHTAPAYPGETPPDRVLRFTLEPAAGKPPSPWELNVGVGRALIDATAQTWLLKAIIGRSF